MFALFASTVETLFSVIAGIAPRHTIQLVLREMRHSFEQRPNGIVGGTYVVHAKKLPVTCVIHALFLFVSGALKMLTM
jgi:hypothetical protein